jgi:FkbM family methyltransferase
VLRFVSKLIPDRYKQEFKIKLGAPHMYWSIANLKRNGLIVDEVIDIGAYKGEFTRDVLKIFPDARYLMVEANPEREIDLKNFLTISNNGKLFYEIALLASEADKQQAFSVMDVASSALEEHNETGAKRVILATKTLDEVAARQGFDKGSFLKLDVQGYELEILKGGTRVLQMAAAVLLEVSLLDIHKHVPLLHEVLNFMFDHGFVAYDICSVSARRPLDMALWQTDVLFVKSDSPLRSDKRYW